MRIQTLIKTVAAVGALAIAGAAQASSVYLDVNGTGATSLVGDGSGHYGKVEWLNNASSGVDFTVTLYSAQFVVTGSHIIFGFNATGVGTGDIGNITFGGTSYNNLAIAGIANGGQTGSYTFQFAIDCILSPISSCPGNGGSEPYATPLKFTVGGSRETDFGMAVTGSGGYAFTADVLADKVGGGNVTGAIYAMPGQTSVPEPATLGLLGLGLAGVGFARRRKQA